MLGLPAYATTALIFGILRKEMALGTLVVLCRDPGAQQRNVLGRLYTFAIVNTLFVPCISTIAVLYKQTGLKTVVLDHNFYGIARDPGRSHNPPGLPVNGNARELTSPKSINRISSLLGPAQCGFVRMRHLIITHRHGFMVHRRILPKPALNRRTAGTNSGRVKGKVKTLYPVSDLMKR